MAKAQISIDRVRELLKTIYSQISNESILPIQSGSSSAVGFTFIDPEGKERVILIRTSGQFAKEVAVRTLLEDSEVPVPQLLNSGKVDDQLDYLIVEKASGVVVDDDASARACLEEVMPIFAKIRGVNHGKKGFGFWDPLSLNAPFDTWKEFMLDITTGDWSICPDQTVVVQAHEIIKSSIGYLPEINALLHGDMSGGNFFVEDGTTSAVIDWEISMYGDPIYEYAYMTVFYPDTLPGVLEALPSIAQTETTHYWERFMCSRLYPLLKYTRMHYLADSPHEHERAKYYDSLLHETVKMYSVNKA
jgi:hygromycin-B 4-O-kinase